MKRSVFLSTFLFAAMLSPITLQGYNCAPPAQARLSVLELRVGSFSGENTIEGFNPNVFSYDVRFPESESVGVLWVRTSHPSTGIDVEYDGLPVQLVGQSVAELDVPLGSSELTIHVIRRGPTVDSNTYVVRIQRVPVFACTEQGIRDAIAYGGGPNLFDCDGPTTVLTEAEIVIDNDVILDGEGNLIVDASGGGGGGGGAGGAGGAGLAAGEVAPKVNGAHRVFSIPEGATAELIGFTMTGGSTTEAGGGILNAGTLTLASSTLTGNTADSGGGVWNGQPGTVKITDSLVYGNTAASFGGGILNAGFADMTRTSVLNNNAGQASGAISNRPGATLTMTGCTVHGNTAARNNAGIGSWGTITVTNTTVSGNVAGEGRAGVSIRGAGTMTLVNTTVFGNTAPAGGAGLWNEASLTTRNTIVAGDCVWALPIVSLGGNIESEGNTCGFSQPTDQVSVPTALLNLGPLQDNGGPTMTHALGAGSVAIDWIPEADCVDADGAPLTTDQRGLPRPVAILGPEPMCDVGAFEVQSGGTGGTGGTGGSGGTGGTGGTGGAGGSGGIGSRDVCQTCVADSECGVDGIPSDEYRCVPMFYPEPPTRFPDSDTGFCLKIVGPGGCEQPYAITISDRSSVSDPTLRSYCGINEALATCSAVRALELNETCPSGSDAECPVGGLCRDVGGLANRCTYRCNTFVECKEAPAPGSTCGSSGSGGDDYCGG